MALRIASINVNRRLSTDASAARLARWIYRVRPDILCCQEVGFQPMSRRVGHLELVSATANLACWSNRNVSMASAAGDSDWQCIEVPGNVVVHNVYLSPYSSLCRRVQLSRIGEQVATRGGDRIVVLGDFNLAPQQSDGWFGPIASRFTRAAEREAFRQLLGLGLVDLMASQTGREFTYERQIRGRCSRFRCDLVLASVGMETRSWHDHSTRVGAERFTDHSAVIAEVVSPESRRP